MIEIDLDTLRKGEKRIPVKGHQTKTGYIKPHIRIVKTAAEADVEMDEKLAVLRKYKEAAARTDEWITLNPDRHVDVGEVNNYTVGDYDAINEALREKFTDEELSETPIKDQIKSISAFLRDAPKYNGITYRGMGFDIANWGDRDRYNKFINDFTDSEFITLPSFTSTTHNKEIAIGFTGTRTTQRILFEIESKHGVVLDGAAQFAKEQEILFDKDSQFKVISVKRDGKTMHVKLEEI